MVSPLLRPTSAVEHGDTGLSAAVYELIDGKLCQVLEFSSRRRLRISNILR